MKWVLLTVGKGGNAWADEAVADYGRRLRRWGGLDEIGVKPERFRGDVEAVRTAEAERLQRRVTPRDLLVVLDERGDDLDTDGFIGLVQAARTSGAQRTVFVLGGAYGHDEATRQAAWRTIRLSSLVLNHEVARVVCVEQLYRALATIHGVPYHH